MEGSRGRCCDAVSAFSLRRLHAVGVLVLWQLRTVGAWRCAREKSVGVVTPWMLRKLHAVDASPVGGVTFAR